MLKCLLPFQRLLQAGGFHCPRLPEDSLFGPLPRPGPGVVLQTPAPRPRSAEADSIGFRFGRFVSNGVTRGICVTCFAGLIKSASGWGGGFSLSVTSFSGYHHDQSQQLGLFPFDLHLRVQPAGLGTQFRRQSGSINTGGEI